MQAKKKKTESAIAVIAKTKDVDIIAKAIYDKYGFWVTPEYAADLVDFVNELTEEMTA